MTDLDHLIRRLETDPDTDIGAAMLIDELMEAKGMLYTEAERHVERLRADARSALQIAFVAGLIRAKGPAYYALRNAIAQLLPQIGDAPYLLYVVSGDEPPHLIDEPPGKAARRVQPHLFVALPSGWVVNWFRTKTLPIHPPKQRR